MTSKPHDNKIYNENVKAFFRSNSWKKTLTFLFFLLLAGGFWLLQSLEQTFEVGFSVKINYENIPENVTLSSDVPEELNIRIKDRGSKLFEYGFANRKKKKPFKIDLEKLDFKKSTYTITKRQLEDEISKFISPSATLISSSPDLITINLEPLQKKELPVVLSGSLKPALGYGLIDSTLFTPSIINVYGTQSVLDSLSAIYTESLHIENITKPIKRQINLTIPKGTKINPASVELNVSANEYTEKTIKVPVICTNVPNKYSVRTFPNTVEIICLVSLSDYEKVKESDFVVTINYTDLLQNKNYTAEVKLTKKPNLVKTFRINPEKVEFLIEEKKEL